MAASYATLRQVEANWLVLDKVHRRSREYQHRPVLGHGTAWGGHFPCTEDISWVQTPDAPLVFERKNERLSTKHLDTRDDGARVGGD